MPDWLPNLLALVTAGPPPAGAAALADALRERVTAWLAGAETHAPALLLGLALLLAVPPLALAGLAVRRLAAGRKLAGHGEDGQDQQCSVPPGDGLEARPGHAWLELESEPGHRLPVAGEIVRIGREDDNDLRLEGRAVHRYHAVVQRTPDQGFVITDVSSGNGVRVNGERRARSGLRDGDRLEIGGTAIRFHLETAA